jgi:hypothetical protein
MHTVICDWGPSPHCTFREELQTRLPRAEKLRVHDVWALMQATSNNTTSATSNSTSTTNNTTSSTPGRNIDSVEQGASAAAREDAASRVALLRALELDKVKLMKQP